MLLKINFKNKQTNLQQRHREVDAHRCKSQMHMPSPAQECHWIHPGGAWWWRRTRSWCWTQTQCWRQFCILTYKHSQAPSDCVQPGIFFLPVGLTSKVYKMGTYTETTPASITGFRPYLSAIMPQYIDVKNLPIMKADPEIITVNRLAYLK